MCDNSCLGLDWTGWSGNGDGDDTDDSNDSDDYRTRVLMDVRRFPIFRGGKLTTAKWCNLSGWHSLPDYWSSFPMILCVMRRRGIMIKEYHIFELTSNWAHFSLDYQENDLCEENSLACSRSTSLLKSGLMAYCSRTQVIYLSYLASNIVFGVPGFKYQILIFTSCANKVPHATLLSSRWKSIHLCDFCDERTSTYGIIFVINSSQRSLMLPISLFSLLLLSTVLK